MSRNNKIIIIPYFGKLPRYFDFFVKSCLFNQSQIDYLFLSDIPKPQNLAPNIVWESFSLIEFNQLASKKLQVPVQIKNPYKMCDFKPCFGLIFEDYILDYPFWGHGDEDLILGDLSNFLPSLEKNFDIISVREEWNSGPFMLYRNLAAINLLFKASKDWQKILATEKYIGFDETFLDWDKYRKPDFDVLKEPTHNMTYLVRKAQSETSFSVHTKTLIKESIPENDYLHYSNGKILDAKGKEFLLYHFISEKKNLRFEFPNWDIVPNEYYIDNTGFFTKIQFLENN